MKEETVEWLKKEAARKCWSDDPGWADGQTIVDDFAAGNIDDAYAGGNDDGRAELAREILAELARQA
jgi:hypothetical protein